MYCSKCGTPLPEEAAFCQKCGNKVANAGRPATADDAASEQTVVKNALLSSNGADASLKHKSKLCFFLAIFPLIATGLLGVMSGVMTIFWINLGIAVVPWVAGWFFFARRHCFGIDATLGVTALFSFVGAYLIPIIPICAWHVWHLRKIFPEKRPPVNDNLVLAILTQLGVVQWVLLAGVRFVEALSSTGAGSVCSCLVGLLYLPCALPGYLALKNAMKVVSCDFESETGRDEAVRMAKKARWLAIVEIPFAVLPALLIIAVGVANR